MKAVTCISQQSAGAYAWMRHSLNLKQCHYFTNDPVRSGTIRRNRAPIANIVPLSCHGSRVVVAKANGLHTAAEPSTGW